MDIFQKCEDYTLTRELKAASIYAYFRQISSPQDPVVDIGGDKVVMLGSNNYLGLTNHPEVKKAAAASSLKQAMTVSDERGTMVFTTEEIHLVVTQSGGKCTSA